MIILDETQANLLRSFLFGHSKEIENSKHADAMFGILSILSSNPARPDEGKVCDVILENVDLLTCFNCGEKLIEVKEKDGTVRTDDFIGEFCIDPGESNYPREPDVPAAVYFVCVKCSHIERREK